MNGPHDVGGRHGLGPIAPEADEPVFHAEWERRMFGIAYCILTSGCHPVDATRHACEHMPHDHYIGSSYYEHWLFAYQRTLHERGICTHDEVDRRVEELAAGRVSYEREGGGTSSDLARRVMDVLRTGRPHRVPASTEPAFRPGDRVRALNLHSKRHLRLPAYAKGRAGVVEAYHGHFEHPEAQAHGEPDPGAHVYLVAFSGAELWGPDAERADDVVCLDLIENYLEAA